MTCGRKLAACFEQQASGLGGNPDVLELGSNIRFRPSIFEFRVQMKEQRFWSGVGRRWNKQLRSNGSQYLHDMDFFATKQIPVLACSPSSLPL